MADTAVEPRLEQYRGELTAFCYRMLGSPAEAEDAVQDTMIRAWRAYDRFEGRSQLRSWLYRIATNVCFDMLNGRKKRALPMDLAPARTSEDAQLGTALPESAWVQPLPDGRTPGPTDGRDPGDQAVGKDSVRLAFVAALQHLPARQRAVLILREVLRWKADEVAELLGTTTASVNSALQRARATLGPGVDAADEPDALDTDQQELLARYVDAFERYDIDLLVSLLAEDAVMSMPPYPLWLTGHEDIAWWLRGPGEACGSGSRLVPVAGNAAGTFGHYRPSPGGGHEAFSLVAVDVRGGRLVSMHHFLDVDVQFPRFGLPMRLD